MSTMQTSLESKREKLAHLLRRKMERDKIKPLSFAQQRLWLIDQIEPGTAAYNLPFRIRLRGDLDYAAVEKSLNEIVRRHEVLRTSFVVQEGKPEQRISSARELPLRVVDLSWLG